MKTAVDSNVLFDVLIPGAEHQESSQAALVAALADGPMTVAEAVYAELAGSFASREELDRFVVRSRLQVEPMGMAALYEAGRAWTSSRRNRPVGLFCSRCSNPQAVTCRVCGAPLQARQHVLPDFLIGAHALRHADRLLTRDRGFYGTYFPALAIMSPA